MPCSRRVFKPMMYLTIYSECLWWNLESTFEFYDVYEALEGFLGIKGYWRKYKGIRDIYVNIKRDTGYLNYFWDIGIQCFLNFLDICHNYFRDMGYWDPLPGPHL